MTSETTNPWPRELTPALRELLGFMCFQLGPMAHLYQAAGMFLDADGCEMSKRAEDEQAFMLHRFLTHWFEHGEDWREPMRAELRTVSKAACKAERDAEGIDV